MVVCCMRIQFYLGFGKVYLGRPVQVSRSGMHHLFVQDKHAAPLGSLMHLPEQ